MKSPETLAEKLIPAISDDFTYPGSAVTDIKRRAFIKGYRAAQEENERLILILEKIFHEEAQYGLKMNGLSGEKVTQTISDAWLQFCNENNI